MSYDPDKIFGTHTSSGGYDPDAIFEGVHPQKTLGYVDQNIDSGDLGMSEDDYASKAVEKEDLGVMGAFKGAFENLGMVLSMPYGVAGGVAGAIGDTASEVGTIAAGINPFSDVKLSDSTMFDRSLKESAQGVRSQFGEDMGQNMYIPQSEEAQRVAGAIGDAIPREALQIAEGLPPAGVAIRAANGGGFAADVMGATGRGGSEVANEFAKLERSQALSNPLQDGIDRATAAVRARGERVQANTDTLSGATTGSKFMPDEHIEMVENATPAQKRLYQQAQEDAKQANNGAGETERSSWTALGEQFQERATVLGEVGESYLGDMNKAREDIKQMTESGGVRTLTGELQESVASLLADNRITWNPETQKLDFAKSPVFNGQAELQRSLERFLVGTKTDSKITGSQQNYASFEDLHYLKQALQQAGYGARRTSGSGDKSTQLIQQISGIVNDTIRGISPAYADANDGLSMVIGSFNDLAKATKTDVSIGDADFTNGQWRRVAQNSRRLTSNTDSGINMDQTLKDIDDVLVGEAGKGEAGNVSPEQLARLGMRPDGQGGFTQETNLRQLALFSNYMDILHGDGKPTAFKGLIAQANDRHLENLVANSVWGNQVGASASFWKATMQKLRGPEYQMRTEGDLVKETDELRKMISLDVDEAIKEMLGRSYE